MEGSGFPNSSTVGRNTLRTAGTNNFDANLSKSIPLGERKRIELRLEALNALNHPQFFMPVVAASRNVIAALPGRFLNPEFTSGGIRSMWVQVKVVF